MKLKVTFLLVAIYLILNSTSSFALQISSIDFDPAGSDTNKEWFEVCNDGTDILSFADSLYKAITPSSSGFSSHDINKDSSADLMSSECAAIVDDIATFKTYRPDYTNKIFDSSFSLINSGGFVGIAQDKNILVCKSYGSGVCPTNTNTGGGTNSTSSTSTNSTTTNKSQPELVYIYIPMNNQMKYGDIKLLLPEERIVPALADTEYLVKAVDSSNKVISDLDFNWSFGDGGEKYGKTVSYHYVYPGDYTLVVSADGFTSGAQAFMKVKVVSPKIEILGVGGMNGENIIDISNHTGYDIFLSQFYLVVDGKEYILPKNLLIAKDKTVHISGEAVGFKKPTLEVSLLYPNKKVLNTYFIPDLTQNLDTTSLLNLSSTSAQIKNTISSNLLLVQTSTSSSSTNTNISINQISTSKPKKRNIFIADSAPALDTKTKDKETISVYSVRRLILDKDLEKIKDFNLNSSIKNSIKPSQITGKDVNIINWLKNLIY